MSPLAKDMNPGAASVVTIIVPGCLTGVVSDMIPDFKSSAFSDLIIFDDVSDVKWSVIRRMNCPSRLITSAWKNLCGCLTSDFVSFSTEILGCFWMIEQV